MDFSDKLSVFFDARKLKACLAVETVTCDWLVCFGFFLLSLFHGVCVDLATQVLLVRMLVLVHDVDQVV